MKLDKMLIRGSFILLISFGIFNFLNFAFHFSMVRMLSVAEYGVLASLFSIIYALSVFSESIQIVIVKYTSKEDSVGKLKNILKKSLKKSFLASVVLFGIYLVLSIPLSNLLNIELPLILLNGFIIFLFFVQPITRGILQGRKRFSALGVNMVVESSIKLVLAIVFVMIGWKVYGAILGTILGAGLSFGLIFINFGDILKAKERKANTGGIYGYTKPTFFIMLAILTFYSIDIIIAKIYFSDHLAGSYAIASILAKTIFFGTQPISRAMFPLSSGSRSKKNSDNVFSNALIILVGISLIALTIFYLFPGFIIEIFSGESIEEAAGILFYLGIGVSFLSISNLILLYKLSRGKVKGYVYLFVFLIVELFLLGHFSADLVQFSLAFVTASAMFLWGSIFLLNE